MNANKQSIESFYRAFQEKDSAAMGACYDPSIHFSDPVFTDLHGREVEAMWHMLCEQGTDLEIVFSNIGADERTGSAHWEATYRLESTGRVVHNRIDAAFTFHDGRIVRHVDRFDLWRWARMALGATGTVGGWSKPVQGKIRSTATRGLTRFIESHPEYQQDDEAAG